MRTKERERKKRCSLACSRSTSTSTLLLWPFLSLSPSFFSTSFTPPLLLLLLSLTRFRNHFSKSKIIIKNESQILLQAPQPTPRSSPPLAASAAPAAASAARRNSVAASAAAPASGPGADPSRRVVVTGMGVVSCLGNEIDEFYGNLLAVRMNDFRSFEFFSCARARSGARPKRPFTFFFASFGPQDPRFLLCFFRHAVLFLLFLSALPLKTPENT